MTPRERVMARLAGRPVDKVPNHCIIMAFAAKQGGVPYSQYVSDYKTLVSCALACCEKYGIDVLSVISDPMREASGFGAEVIIPHDAVPYSPTPFLEQISDVGKLKLIDPSKSERMNDRLEAVRLFREKAGQEYPVLGWVEGAIAESCDLRDLSNLMMDIMDEPDAVTELLDICTRQAIIFAKAQIDAGADIIGIGDAAASLVGPALFEEFVLPCQRRIVAAIHEAGAKAKLHICGNINPLLPMLTETGADMIDCDWMVDFDRAVSLFGDKSAACGNFDPVEIVLRGTPETVRAAVRGCLANGSKTSGIAAGCEIPRDTPPENLLAVAQELELYR